MSFLFNTITLPFWFVLFVFGSASPLWFKWLKKIRRSKSDDEVIDSIFKKASNHVNDNGENSSHRGHKRKKRKTGTKRVAPEKKQNMKVVLQVLAESGETGVLAKSISDRTSIDSLETGNALKYLVEKEYAEVVNGTTGEKYYLTDLGRRYCINKRIL